MTITPLFDRILLKPIVEKMSDGGIYLPNEAGVRSQIMTVVAVGSGFNEDGQKIEMIVAVGERVVVSRYAGTEVVLGTEKLWILKQCDILAKVSDLA